MKVKINKIYVSNFGSGRSIIEIRKIYSENDLVAIELYGNLKASDLKKLMDSAENHRCFIRLHNGGLRVF